MRVNFQRNIWEEEMENGDVATLLVIEKDSFICTYEPIIITKYFQNKRLQQAE